MSNPPMPPPVTVEVDGFTSIAEALEASTDAISTPLSEPLPEPEPDPRPVLTLDALADVAQTAYERNRCDPRESRRRFTAVLRAVFAAFDPVRAGEAVLADELRAMLEGA